VTPLRRSALPLAVLAWVALAIAALVVAMGPVSVPALALSMSRPSRLLGAAIVFAAVAGWARGGIGPLLDDLAQARAPYVATLLLVIVSLLALLHSHGAVSVGGADSAGYLAQAQRWRDGRLHVPLPLSIPGVPDPWPQSGLGLRPDATGTATVPTYPPGLPWLEAIALRVGGETVAVRVLPAAAAVIALIAIWFIAVQRAGHPGAVLVVSCLATLPTFLYQALQPMSDVPALAAWLAALALAGRPSIAGLTAASAVTATAVLIRPNLAPLVVAVAWQATLPDRAWRRGLAVMAAAGIAAAGIAGVQTYLYGSPLQSGYGRASELFAVSYIPSNLALYAAWLREGLAWPSRCAIGAGGAWLLVCAVRHSAWRPVALMAVLTIGLYLVYLPFDSWTYLRFVLVTLALAPLGLASILRTLQGSRHARWTFVVTAALSLGLVLPSLRLARDLTVFTVRAREYRYQAAGTFVRDHLPPDVVIVAVQHSASTPYYSGRPVIRPDLLTPDGWRALVAWADRERRPLAFVLDEAEPAALRRRFGDDGLTALEWPPRAEVGRPVATRVWVDVDRPAYLAGSRIRTTRITAIPK
jgi:hypothetical protein